jgi:tRNA A-37 threonylcarbamoyl transferase component Bud32
MPEVAELYGKPWSRNEYLIVLSAYFKTRDSSNDTIERAIHDTSHAIGRTNRSVGMRLANFASIDPEVRKTKRGLDHVDLKCRTYFSEWCDRLEVLHEVAAALRSDLEGGEGTLFDLHRVRLPYAFRRYELGDLIGEGAFGAVYSCIDTKTEESRAIKIFRHYRIEEASMVHRFRREIKILRQAQHPNVISLHEDNLDSEERFPAFVMDLADCSLPQYVQALAQREGRTLRPLLTAREAGAILSDVMLGVSALHEHNPPIIHRDINPNNILRMPDGRWVIADFTLSKFLLGTASTYVTATTTRGWGTMFYAAPEQWRDFKAVDHRCDIYALGAVIWDLFTSGLPPRHDADLQLSTSIEAIVQKAMAREPSDRHTDVRQLRQELLGAIATEE